MGIGYRLGEWTIRPHRNRIERGDELVHLAPKAMAVLDCLAKASNSVVTRQQIFDSVWPGAAISDDALTQRIAELRKAFEDSAQKPEIIETIPKIGFRLIPPVIPLTGESVTNRGSHQVADPEHKSKWVSFATIGLLVVILSLGYFWLVVSTSQETSSDADTPVIAVLPFVNMSEDIDNEYFSDGISEELINLLAKVPNLDTISRTSSFSFKGGNWKMADLARELNASLIVEGTVRKVDKQVRITAQLIDTRTDKHLWSESYDRELSNIFSLQEEIAQSIVTALQDEVGPHTVTVRRPTDNIEAYDLFLSGRYHFYQRGPALDTAITLFQMAANEDPGFVEAWSYLAAAGVVTCFYQTSISDEDAYRMAQQASSKALALVGETGLLLAVQAMIAYTFYDLITGFQTIDRAVNEHPHDTTARLWAGMYYLYWGYLEKARTHFLYVQTQEPWLGIVNGNLGLVYMAQGREDLAAPLLARATELGYPNHHHAQASLLMKRGDIDGAFAKLRISLANPATAPDRLSWMYELESVGRSYIENQESADALISVIERVPRPEATEKARLALLFDLKDMFFEYFPSSVEEGHLWLPFLVPTLWLVDYRDYVEDPRYFETMRQDGAVEVWEKRGYLDGCMRVNNPDGDRLDCSKRYQ